ncbi:MAG: hypothetical protein ABW167_20560 [Baekduia sp.]
MPDRWHRQYAEEVGIRPNDIVLTDEGDVKIVDYATIEDYTNRKIVVFDPEYNDLVEMDEVVAVVLPGADPDAALAQYLANPPREIVSVGWDGASQPMLRYRDELHLPDHRRSIVWSTIPSSVGT